MTADQSDLLREAQESLAAAKLLLSGGYSGYAASRAYYSMFYVTQAFLEGEGMAFSKHSAVIAAFGRHFVHTGKVPVEYHRFLLEAQELRHEGDYGSSREITANQAQEQIRRAERFLELAGRLLGPISPTSKESGQVE